MKLWIKTQDKTRLLEANDIRVEPIQFLNANNNNELNVIDKVVGGKIIVNSSVVAKYDTVNRALQVLEEIQKNLNTTIMLNPKQNTKSKEQNNGLIESNTNFKVEPLNRESIVYEMPEK